VSASRAELEAAYLRTQYCARLARGEVILRIGAYDEAADRRLRVEAGVRAHWAILTPCNPQSQLLTAEDNAARLARLARRLAEARIRVLPSLNRDPQGAWPDEDGFFLCDPPAGAAQSLGREFDQNAIVVGELGQPPRLVWLRD
jgi:hypothetical protein